MGIGRVINCKQQSVTKRLDDVFNNPGTPKYQRAQHAGKWFKHAQNTGDWKDLLAAYLTAGVDVEDEWPGWLDYLEQLGTSAPKHISAIAKTRFDALKNGTAVKTNKHDPSIGPGQTTPDSIDSPCPPQKRIRRRKTRR